VLTVNNAGNALEFAAIPASADGSITTAKIANDAVTLDKMAGLARGKIIVGGSSGNPTALAPGTAGQLLQSNGTDISYVNPTNLNSTTLGAVGTYGFFLTSSGDGGTDPGGTRSGSTLKWSDTEDNYEALPAASGTWRCMGHQNRFAASTLFVRIS